MNRILASLLLLGSLQAMPARAHQVESALRYVDGDLELSSNFSNGEPTQGAMVRLIKADGTPGQALGRIDDDGKLNLDLRDFENGVVDLQIDGGPGHRDYLTLPVEDGRVQLDEVVQVPMLLVLVGSLVSVKRRRDEGPPWHPAPAAMHWNGWWIASAEQQIQNVGMNTFSGWPKN